MFAFCLLLSMLISTLCNRLSWAASDILLQLPLWSLPSGLLSSTPESCIFLKSMLQSSFSKKWSMYLIVSCSRCIFFSDFPNKLSIFFLSSEYSLVDFLIPWPLSNPNTAFRHEYLDSKPTDEKQFPSESPWWESQWTHKNPHCKVLWKLIRNCTLFSRASECLKTNQHMLRAFLPASLVGLKGFPSPLS